MYNHEEIEKKWQEYWDKNKTFKTDIYDFSKPKYYCLDMFPYPSGEGLHVGHPEGYTATDIVARMKRMQGYNVLHPMGFDSFGLPAEQYAIKTGNHPGIFTEKNISNFTRQMKELGFSYDWDRAISTSDPKFYKWTQWIFKQMYLKGLAECTYMPVNWCQELGTVLANDEIINGKSERGGYPVIRKNMRQWVMKMPKYADLLLEGLNKLNWPESTKEMQRNWIGKSVGAEIKFNVKNTDYNFTVFTTRCDTLFGATYCVLSPEHDLIDKIVTEDKKEEVTNYKNMCSLKSELERTDLNKDKTGVFTGAFAINPVNGKELPIWISDYVLLSYGTGAIMAVPAHDERDYDFAKKFDLDIIPVLDGGNVLKEAFTGDGLHINSDFLNGLNKEEALKKMFEFIESNNIGVKKVNYRLRDWIFARQRYWGEPVPIVHLENNKEYVLKDNELPLVLPVMSDYKGKNGNPPLDNADDWKNVVIDGVKGVRETCTMPGSAGSSWYYLRYIDPDNDNEFVDKTLADHWMPVDLYMGGAEHAVGHLLYSRFWNRFLYNEGYITNDEPFKRLVHQGMILGENNEKMSKSRGNVINPDDMIKIYGADSLRLYEMFMGPIESAKPWDSKGIEASRRFIERIYRLYTSENKIKNEKNINLDKVYNQTVKKVTEDYESLNINTAISQMMIFINAVYKENVFPLEYAKNFLKLINPIIPHVTEELWSLLGETNTIAYEKWPIYDGNKLKDDSYEMVVQVNGKVRGKIEVSSDTKEEEMVNIALKIPNVKLNIDGKEIVKVITVPKKIVNIVIR